MIPKNFYQLFYKEYQEIKKLEEQGILKFEMPFATPSSRTYLNDKKIISFASNDYLSFIYHPDVIKAAHKALDMYGTGAGSGILGSGSLRIHKELKEELADFLHMEDVIIFPTGYSAMLGFAAANIINGAKIYYDSLSHRSMIDGVNLGIGSIRDFEQGVMFKHNSLKSLEKKFTTSNDNSGYNILFVEGVYSMDGDIGNLVDFVPFCQKNEFLLAVDDCHAIGILGDHGRGLASSLHLEKNVDFILGTFSKTFAVNGGFIAGSKEMLSYLKLLSSSYIFSAAMIPVNVMVIRKILSIIKNDDSYQNELWDKINRMTSGLKNLGFDIGNTNSAIIPVYVRNTEKTLTLFKMLLDNGFYVFAATPPAVCEGGQLIRISMNRAHTYEEIDRFLNTIYEISKSIGL